MVKFAQYAPDISSLGTGVSSLVQNVIPRMDGYGPFKSFQAFSQSLPGTCRGYFFARRSDGSIAIFAGTSTNLYLLNNSDLSWTLVSKGGTAYGSVPQGDNWQFVQFNDTVIAVQINTAPQKYALSVDAAFSDLAGSPPNAGAIAVVGFFLVLTRLLANPRRVQWSDLGNIIQWTAGIGLSDFQDLSDGGNCSAITGGDAYGVVFQDGAIRTFTYAPGAATVFQIFRIAQDDGIYARYGLVNAGSRTYFISPQGFKRIDPGGVPMPIGKGFVDDFFKQDVDPSSLQLAIGASDPTSTRIFFAYKSSQGQAGLIDKILVFDPSIGPNGSWSIIVGQALEYLTALARPGITLEGLDAIAPTPLNVQAVADNGSGKVRLTMDAVSNANFSIAGQNTIVVYGAVGGPAGINGTHLAVNVVVVNATHVDLLDVNYAAGYTSGGHIGGSIDALVTSLDNISVASLSQLSAVGSQHAPGFFTGPTLEATLETEEQDSQGTLVFIGEGIIPITDCGTVMGSIGYRMTAQASVRYTSESKVNMRGYCPLTIEARYARARLRFPVGATWTYARGVQPDVQAAGDT
jgi:hypothetical protein